MTRRHDTLFFTALILFAVTGITAFAPGLQPVQVAQMDPQVSDATIQSKVEAQLRLDPRLNWELLQVKVDKGQVALFGKVASPEEMGFAETVASTVPGVKGLTNQIIIDPALAPDHKLRNDIWSAMKTVPALERNPTIRINVHDGEVVLLGDVQGENARKAAEIAAQSVGGVRKVDNQLKVVPNVPGAKIDPSTRNPILDSERQVVP